MHVLRRVWEWKHGSVCMYLQSCIRICLLVHMCGIAYSSMHVCSCMGSPVHVAMNTNESVRVYVPGWERACAPVFESVFACMFKYVEACTHVPYVEMMASVCGCTQRVFLCVQGCSVSTHVDVTHMCLQLSWPQKSSTEAYMGHKGTRDTYGHTWRSEYPRSASPHSS